MDDTYNDQESHAETGSIGVEEALNHFRNTVHELRLQDATSRQKIRKLERDNEKMEKEIQSFNTNIESIEKQKTTDEQYLLKQQEIIVNLEMAEEVKGHRATEVEAQKDRLKFKKASVNRAENLQANLRNAAHSYEHNVTKIAELQEISEQIDEIDEENKPALVNDLLVKMIDVLEKSVKSKEGEIQCIKQGIDEDNKFINDEITDLNRRNGGIKRLRVDAQKKIFDFEKKLNYLEEELGEGVAPEVENLDELDLNKEATVTNNKTNDILKDLRYKLETVTTGEKFEQRFIRELPK
jgi:predicted  nucleic acid-binding Zn-ribbon protein